MRIANKDATEISSNWTHDNIRFGMKLYGVWGVTSVFDTVENNGYSQVFVHRRGWGEPFGRPNRWVRLVGGDFIGAGSDVIVVEEVEGTGTQAPCNSNTSVCDLWISGNYVRRSFGTSGNGIGTTIYGSPFGDATWLLRDNWIYASSSHVAHKGDSGTRNRCWDDNNNCYGLDDEPRLCENRFEFARTTCWY
jgi:hypothetical protein